MKLVPHFSHTPGIHCGSTAMSDLLRHIGLDYSEAMCFGLGSGLGFYYFRDPRGASPSHLIHGRTLNLERDVCAHLGLDFEEGADDDAAHAWRITRDFIDRDIPVLLHVELSQLPYYHARTPFPGHRVVLAGYDDARRVAFLADTKFPGLQEVSFDNLRAARTARRVPEPDVLEHHLHRVRPAQAHLLLDRAEDHGPQQPVPDIPQQAPCRGQPGAEGRNLPGSQC